MSCSLSGHAVLVVELERSPESCQTKLFSRSIQRFSYPCLLLRPRFTMCKVDLQITLHHYKVCPQILTRCVLVVVSQACRDDFIQAPHDDSMITRIFARDSYCIFLVLCRKSRLASGRLNELPHVRRSGRPDIVGNFIPSL
jgi:hypothetical protein